MRESAERLQGVVRVQGHRLGGGLFPADEPRLVTAASGSSSMSNVSQRTLKATFPFTETARRSELVSGVSMVCPVSRLVQSAGDAHVEKRCYTVRKSVMCWQALGGLPHTAYWQHSCIHNSQLDLRAESEAWEEISRDFWYTQTERGRRSDTAQSNSLVDGSGSGSEAKTDDRNDLRCGLFEFATLSSCQLNVTG